MNYSQGKKEVREIRALALRKRMHELSDFNRCGEVSRR